MSEINLKELLEDVQVETTYNVLDDVNDILLEGAAAMKDVIAEEGATVTEQGFCRKYHH